MKIAIQPKHNSIKLALAIALIILAGAIAVNTVIAVPPIATEFYGTLVLVNNTNASANARVFAYYGEDSLCGQYTVRESGRYGLLSCSDDENLTDGDDIRFYALNSSVIGTNMSLNISLHPIGDTSFEEGEYKNVNLSFNFPPEIESIESLTAYVNRSFLYAVNASDPDNDTLTYSASFSGNITLFTINSSTGVIYFTPNDSMVGQQFITIYASDGYVSASTQMNLLIRIYPYCGDGTCDVNFSENCATCADDCGACPGGGSGGSGGSTSGSGGSTSTSSSLSSYSSYCSARWMCNKWTACSPEGTQERKCVDISYCGSERGKPTEQQECEYVQTCFDSYLNQDESDIDCGGKVCEQCEDGKKCLKSNDCKSEYCYNEVCRTPSCFDSIQNQNETEVDCGGPCTPCIDKKYAKPPLTETPFFIELKKQFPWILLIILAAIFASFIAGDRGYVQYLHKIDREEYKKKIKDYKIKRKRGLVLILDISFILLTTAFYAYYTSDCTNCIWKFIWIPIAVIISIPSIIAFAMNKWMYSAYRREKEESRLQLRHELEKKRLVKIENRILTSIEKKVCNDIFKLIDEKHVAKEEPEAYLSLKDVYDTLAKLSNLRLESLKKKEMEKEIKKIIMGLLDNKNITRLSNDYMEIKEIITNLKKLVKKPNSDFAEEKEREITSNIRELAADKHMLSVIQSKNAYIKAYNSIVDVYRHYEKAHKKIDEGEKVMTEIEQEMPKKSATISKGASMTILTSQRFQHINENLEILIDHYNKKKELILESTGNEEKSEK